MSESSTLAGLKRSSRVPNATDAAAHVPQPARRWGTRVAVPALIVLSFLLVVGYAARDVFTPKLPVEVVPVVVKRGGAVSSGAVATQAAGWVEPDPLPVYVSALANGVVDEVLVLDGATVEAGDVLVRMIDDDARLALDRAVARTAELTAAVARAEAELHAAERDWDEPVQRDRAVAVAEASLVQARAELATAEAQVGVHAAEIARLRDELERRRIEVQSGASSEFLVTQTALEIDVVERRRTLAEARVGRARGVVTEAEAELVAAREERRLRIPETLAKEAAAAAVERARAELADARAAEAEARLRLSRMEIRAPVSGVVEKLLTSPGDKLFLQMDGKHSAHALHLYDPERLQVRVDVPLADAALVGVGQEAKIVVEVLPDQTFEGRVTRVVHHADLQKNTLQFKVAIDDPVPAIKPEMLARVQFFTAAGTTGASGGAARVFVPEELLTDGGSAAWVVDADGRAARRAVETGTARNGDWIEVVSGLAPGDRLIATALDQLEAGRAVRVTGETNRFGGGE